MHICKHTGRIRPDPSLHYRHSLPEQPPLQLPLSPESSAFLCLQPASSELLWTFQIFLSSSAGYIPLPPVPLPALLPRKRLFPVLLFLQPPAALVLPPAPSVFPVPVSECKLPLPPVSVPAPLPSPAPHLPHRGRSVPVFLWNVSEQLPFLLPLFSVQPLPHRFRCTGIYLRERYCGHGAPQGSPGYRSGQRSCRSGLFPSGHPVHSGQHQ